MSRNWCCFACINLQALACLSIELLTLCSTYFPVLCLFKPLRPSETCTNIGKSQSRAMQVPTSLYNNIQAQLHNIQQEYTQTFSDIVPTYLDCLRHCRDFEVWRCVYQLTISASRPAWLPAAIRLHGTAIDVNKEKLDVSIIVVKYCNALPGDFSAIILEGLPRYADTLGWLPPCCRCEFCSWIRRLQN